MWHIVKAAIVAAIQQQPKTHKRPPESRKLIDEYTFKHRNYRALHSIKWHSSLYCWSYMVFQLYWKLYYKFTLFTKNLERLFEAYDDARVVFDFFDGV